MSKPKRRRKNPCSCAHCKWALYDGDEVEDCMHDPPPPEGEPWPPEDGKPGVPCRYWEYAP